MSIFEMASHISPDSMLDNSGKVIWRGNQGEFSYLFRIDNVVYLRMSYSQAQLAFFTLNGDNWLTVNENLYKEIVELWLTEKRNLTYSISSSAQ